MVGTSNKNRMGTSNVSMIFPEKNLDVFWGIFQPASSERLSHFLDIFPSSRQIFHCQV
jgi:hypothetical protein